MSLDAKDQRTSVGDRCPHASRHRAAASEEEVTKLRGELRSLRLDGGEAEELAETNRQLDAANKELGAALDAEVHSQAVSCPNVRAQRYASWQWSCVESIFTALSRLAACDDIRAARGSTHGIALLGFAEAKPTTGAEADGTAAVYRMTPWHNLGLAAHRSRRRCGCASKRAKRRRRSRSAASCRPWSGRRTTRCPLCK